MSTHIKIPPNEIVSLSDLADNDLVGEADACAILGGTRKPINKLTLRRGIESGVFPPALYLKGTKLKRWRVGRLRAVIVDREEAA